MLGRNPLLFFRSNNMGYPKKTDEISFIGGRMDMGNTMYKNKNLSFEVKKDLLL